MKLTEKRAIPALGSARFFMQPTATDKPSPQIETLLTPIRTQNQHVLKQPKACISRQIKSIMATLKFYE
ncbi:hypothetical protein A1OO_12015 [Enterovibrio norvegicus FF-33]|nr:hypothetical protein A1OO_12015 [Enterovibrio norvegicus FF-33]